MGQIQCTVMMSDIEDLLLPERGARRLWGQWGKEKMGRTPQACPDASDDDATSNSLFKPSCHMHTAPAQLAIHVQVMLWRHNYVSQSVE
mmetsp:Transcript_108525/g.350175  ORF Transcript_108525/g.350175 Transcript_108525/m.350175 type:complete len:89 (+) Transcript_108525:114-380(+)